MRKGPGVMAKEGRKQQRGKDIYTIHPEPTAPGAVTAGLEANEVNTNLERAAPA